LARLPLAVVLGRLPIAMSSRAIRALRGDSALPGLPTANLSDDDEDSEDSDARQPRPRTAFSLQLLHDDSDNESSGSSAAADNESIVQVEEVVADTKSAEAERQLEDDAVIPSDVTIEKHEDLDALLSEFQGKDKSLPALQNRTEVNSEVTRPLDFILKSLDVRDLDYDHSMRKSILLNRGGDSMPTQAHNQRPRKSPMFGPPGDGWIRPPRLVGGGIGMVSYDDNGSTWRAPWPYDSMGDEHLVQNWYTFIHSDSYERDVTDYVTVIRQSGNLESLMMFIAHHPYVTSALLQLSTVCYQTNHTQQGLSLLRRCLWIYESSTLANFQNRICSGSACYMDKDRPENVGFFQALFRLLQVSNNAGYECDCAFNGCTDCYF
jgi:Transcriptional repressor TCF25